MSNVNYEVLHRFLEGMRTDFVNHHKSENSYSYGLNGRLYSRNGIVSFSSAKGTLKVFEDESIIKVLGHCAFDDELVLITKYKKSHRMKDTVERNYGSLYSCANENGESISYSEYYREALSSSNVKLCEIETDKELENNVEYDDAFISLRKNDLGELESTIVWVGQLNLPMNAKVCTYGISENSFYKRIYFTDYVNPFMVINLKDSNLESRTAKEFSVFQSHPLLSPLIKSIENGGQIKAGTVLYTYRLITQNGQATEFSPFSRAVKIIMEDNSGNSFKGGNISEVTNRKVSVKCNLPHWDKYQDVECIALEFEAFGAPTSIRNLGIKPTAPYVFFEHYGSESEISNAVTLGEILERKNSWKYCSDLSADKNELIASGLRNDPISSGVNNIQKDFALHAWDKDGLTHKCIMNPHPSRFRFIDPTNTEKMHYVREKMVEYVKVFGDFSVEFKNIATGFSVKHSFETSEDLAYIDFTRDIYEFLENVSNLPSFESEFPNLEFEWSGNKFFLKTKDSSIITDLSDYVLEYSHNQVIESIKEDVAFREYPVDNTKLIYGSQSLGFNSGNGIRITYSSVLEPVLDKATSAYSGGGNILNLKTPNLKKSFFKGEIYRLGFQVFDTSGFQLFNIPIGDIKIPEIGEARKYLNDKGEVVIESEYYSNSKVVDNVMYAEKIILKVEVRISCELQKMISMYQLTYVERSYNNRTILAQGLSAPLERVNLFYHKEHITLPDPVANKWNLPFYGGPTYDKDGLETFDRHPDKDDEWSNFNRVTTSRDLFYFDSPDVINSRIPIDVIRNGSIKRIGRLNPDNSKLSWRKIDAPETFPSFSRKIKKEYLSGTDENKLSYFVNMSVFTEKLGIDNPIKIKNAEQLNPGQIVPGSALGVKHEVSNNAMTLAKQSWFYSLRARESDACQTEDGAKYELFNSSNYSPGYSTVIIKAEENVFTDEFIDEQETYIDGHGEMASTSYSTGYYFSTHALVNIFMNNYDSIYGGRTELAYSSNVYVPLGETIPVLGTSNNTQVFELFGDTYTTLYIRQKNGYNQDEVQYRRAMNNYPNCSRNAFEEKDYTRNGAWNYALVLECSIEPKLNYNDAFYRDNRIDFEKDYSESINEAYFQENTLRSYIPKPYRFKDDPDMSNIVAVSDTKMSGDYIDKWSVFRINNFYELERDKGAVLNLAKFLDQVYTIQENQTSLLSINENVMMNTSDGMVSIQQGTGQPITGHKVISDYGTAIRRAVVEKSQTNGGFAFLDEKKHEWINVNKPLLFENSLHLKFKDLFEDDRIIDTEGYYDDEFKETNIRIRTQKNNNFVLSYNEALSVFNGYLEYDNDLYMVWDNKVFSPKKNKASELHQLNKGIFLNFFGEDHTLKLGVTINVNPASVKLFKSWASNMNIKYPIKRIDIITNLGDTRTVYGDHYRYKIREGRHSVPLKNREDWSDLRGEWATLIVEIEPMNDQKIEIFSFINFVRHSFQ